ncbi:MAG: hypothetical protein HWN67_08085 [Candidatus Helarchaeota archaeon]|nr:hypothetical protein [Candidatus Helarchaeota archaeon]
MKKLICPICKKEMKKGDNSTYNCKDCGVRLHYDKSIDSIWDNFTK